MNLENNNPKEAIVPPFIIQDEENFKPKDFKYNREDSSLVVNGKKIEKYSQVSDRISNQKNNPNLIGFDAYLGEDHSSANYAYRVVDINNPDKELLSATKNKEGEIVVNGQKWDSLRGMEHYPGSSNVEIDPEYKKVVFHTPKAVVVNNIPWKTKFEFIRSATSHGGIAYAIGDGNLVIDDTEWGYSKFIGESYGKPEEKSRDEVRNAMVTKNGQIAAVISSSRGEEKSRQEHILIGDKIAQTNEWVNSMHHIKDIIVNDENNTVAVFGETKYDSKKMGIIINDVPYDLDGAPEKLEAFEFDKFGAVIVQYTDALGEKVTKRFELRKDAKELQEQKETKEKQDKSFEELRKLMIEQNLSPEDVLNKLKNSNEIQEAHDKNVEQNSNLHQNLNKTEQENIRLKFDLEQINKTHQQELSVEQTKTMKAEMVILKLADTLNGAKKTGMISTVYEIDKKSMELAKEVIKNSKDQ